MQQLARYARWLLREPVWLFLIVALVIGIIAGTMVAREQTNEIAEAIFGKAWRKTPSDTRSFLMTMAGLELTVLTILLSLNAPMIQSAANQYSPRLVPYYLKNLPLRRALPLFVLSGAYILAAVREVGFALDETVRPRVVLSGAMILLIVAFAALAVAVVRTYRFMRVERILSLVRGSTFAAIARTEARLQRLPTAPGATLPLPPDATALTALRSGYLVEISVASLARRARRAGVRVRICRAVGDFLDEGEVIGWVGRDGEGPLSARLTRRLAGALIIAPNREAAYDPVYGIRILADVAARALSSTDNDPYTARQALQQLRPILRHLARGPLGDWNVIDPDGAVRVSVMATELREYISMAVEAPLRYGAGDPEVLDGVLELAMEIGLSAYDAEGRAAAFRLVNRVLEDAIEYGKLRDGRLNRLLAEADLVRASLEKDQPRPDRHARADWVLAAAATPPQAPAHPAPDRH